MTCVLVCGGRDYHDRKRVFEVLDEIDAARPIEIVAHGEATGADTLADNWASARGRWVAPFPADWSRFGNAAGPIRNRIMLKEAKPDIVIAFPGGRGTANMVKQARAAGVEVIEVR